MADSRLKFIGNVQHQDSRCDFLCGSIVAGEFPEYLVAVGAECLPAKVATSCLVKPEAGDLVVLARLTASLFITAILERHSQATTLIALGDVAITSVNGSVNVGAKTAIRLEAGTEASISAPLCRQHASQQQIVSESMNIQTGSLQTLSQSASFNSGTVTATVDDAYIQAAQVVKTIENVDITRAATSVQEYSLLYTVRSKTAVITAEDDIKIDGRLIHMG
jgi:hypothetical protein